LFWFFEVFLGDFFGRTFLRGIAQVSLGYATGTLFLDSYLDGNPSGTAFDFDGHLVPPFVFVYFFGGSKLCTSRSRIDSNFIGIGRDRLGIQFPKRRHMATSTYWLFWRTNAIT